MNISLWRSENYWNPWILTKGTYNFMTVPSATWMFLGTYELEASVHLFQQANFSSCIPNLSITFLLHIFPYKLKETLASFGNPLDHFQTALWACFENYGFGGVWNNNFSSPNSLVNQVFLLFLWITEPAKYVPFSSYKGNNSSDPKWGRSYFGIWIRMKTFW